MDSRDAILESLNPLIADLVVKAKGGRIRDEKKAKIRIMYCNALANILRAYNGMLKDKELEELQRELHSLPNMSFRHTDPLNHRLV